MEFVIKLLIKGQTNFYRTFLINFITRVVFPFNNFGCKWKIVINNRPIQINHCNKTSYAYGLKLGQLASNVRRWYNNEAATNIVLSFSFFLIDTVIYVKRIYLMDFSNSLCVKNYITFRPVRTPAFFKLYVHYNLFIN